MKKYFSLFLSLFPLYLIAQENIFHNRNFWNENISVEIVKQKTAEGNNPTSFNNNGFDATTFALLAGANPEVVKYLLSFEDNSIEKRTHDSRIYLHWATMGGNAENVELLLKLGSNPAARDSRGNTPLVFAAGSGKIKPEIGELFIQSGVDITKEKNKQGANILLISSPFMENENDLKYLQEKGLSIHDTDSEGNGIFNYAARRGNTEFLNFLIQNGVNYLRPSTQSTNAFFFAAHGTRGFSNSLETYVFLEKLGLNPNMTTKTGTTPLHIITSRRTSKDIVEFFIKHGADVDGKDEKGNTAFLLAAKNQESEIVKRIASQSKNSMAKNNLGQSALMLATAHNSPEVVAFLMKLNPKQNWNESDAAGNTLGHYLIESFNGRNQKQFEEKLKLLQSKNLDFEMAQAGKNNLFHLAAQSDKPQLFETLAQLGVNINAVNQEGYTPLQITAMKTKNIESLKKLVSLGADKNAATAFGETAYDLATENELLQNQNDDLKFLN